jgi:hypothetical protein
MCRSDNRRASHNPAPEDRDGTHQQKAWHEEIEGAEEVGPAAGAPNEDGSQAIRRTRHEARFREKDRQARPNEERSQAEHDAQNRARSSAPLQVASKARTRPISFKGNAIAARIEARARSGIANG